MSEHCPLCDSSTTEARLEAHGREYWRCSRCQLLFVPSSFHLSTDLERARYEEHNNDPNDSRYIAFLSRLLEPLLEFSAPGNKALDFGCGATETLANCLREKHFSVTCYDPFFFPNYSALKQTYDVIAASEVVEHFSAPRTAWHRLVPLLNPRGLLGIMTELCPDSDSLDEWYYLRDPTHVAFYSQTTFSWIAEHFSLTIEAFFERGVIFRSRNSRQH